MRITDLVAVFGRVVRAARKGELGALVADFAYDEEGLDVADEAPIYSGLGDYGIPDDATDAGRCDACAVKLSDGVTIIGQRDLRLSKRVNPAVGALGKAHYGGGFIELAWTEARDGTIVTILAPHLENDAIDESFGITIDPSLDVRQLSIMHPDGQSVVLADDGGKGTVSITSGNGKSAVVVNSAGVKVRGDAGVKVIAAMTVGNHDAQGSLGPMPTARAQEVIDCITSVATALAAVSTQLMAVPAPGAGIAGQIADLAGKIAVLASTGSSQSLKASP